MARLDRLANRAERAVVHQAGNELPRPGWRARRAWRILRDAADAGDRYAIELVWQAWLRRPDDERWELLTRWRELQDLTEAVLAVAVDPRRDSRSRASLGAFCARHGMTPDDDIQQVLFYALTGQHEQRRAADPGGAMVTAAYQAAARPVQAVLRDALAGAGDLDHVRMIAVGRRGGTAPLTSEETRYLARQLAARGDWARLWRLIPHMPLAEAMTTVLHFGDAWRPADEDGRRLFTLLGSMPPQAVSAVAEDAATRVQVGHRYRWVTFASFALDGSEVGVGWTRNAYTYHTDLYSVASGRLVQRYRAYPNGFVHLGDVVVYREFELSGNVVRHGVHGRELICTRRRGERAHDVVQVPGGFVIRTASRLLFGTATPRSELRELPRHDLGPGGFAGIASHPPSGRLAVLVEQEPDDNRFTVAVLDADGSLVGQAGICGEWPLLDFCSPDRLLVRSGLNRCNLDSWLVGPPLVRTASVRWNRQADLHSLPRAGLVAGRTCGDVVSNFLDAQTLTWADPPHTLRDPNPFWASSTGDHVAVWRPGTEFLEVRDQQVDEVAGLLARPLASTRRADLAVVAAVRPLIRGAEARSVLGLFQACLEHREVAIGRASGAEDIALRADDDR
jgi:hypothetical protein